jgi:peptidoglycan/LPS O-acetylase OafA/YrhL
MPNFDAIRVVLASLVIISHSFALLGDKEPIVWVSTLGSFAVHGFFAMSGYLVATSALRFKSVPRFLGARALRIIPGLVVAWCFSLLAARWAGGYAGNPGPPYINGPVWTLVWEALCYLAVALLFAVGVLRKSAFAAFVAVTWLVVIVNVQPGVDFYAAVVPMLLAFMGGVFLSLVGPVRKWTVIVAAIGLALTVSFPIFNRVFDVTVGWIPVSFAPVGITPGSLFGWIYIACLPIVIVWLGNWQGIVIRLRWDISYGLYIYGWPIGQLLVYVAVSRKFDLSPLTLALATLAITAPVALASWLVVERPALKLKRFLIATPAEEPKSTDVALR